MIEKTILGRGQIDENGKIKCIKCQKTMDAVKKFYTYVDGSKPNICKSCLTMHVDVFEVDTFLWIFEKMDVPYVPEMLNKEIKKEQDTRPDKPLRHSAIIGKYLSRMKMSQWKDKRWADTGEYVEAFKENQELIDDAVSRERKELDRQLKEGLIKQSEYDHLVEELDKEQEKFKTARRRELIGQTPFDEEQFLHEDVAEPETQLSQEEKEYLVTKWGRYYKESEWIELERKYNEMTDSFEIQDSDTNGTLILICKTYLKINQAIDSNDIEAYQKLSRVYDSLRKSAKFKVDCECFTILLMGYINNMLTREPIKW